MRSPHLFILSLLASVGCQGGDPGTDPRTPDQFWEEEFSAELTHGRTIGSSDSFGSIDAIALLNRQRVVVLDAMNSKLKLFDETGKSVSEFGSRGAGPGEFFAPVAVGVSSAQEILVLDRSNRRIVVLGAGRDSLRLIREISVPFAASDLCLIRGRVFLVGLFNNYLIHEVNSSGEVLRSFFELLEENPMLRSLSGMGHLSCSEEADALAWAPWTMATLRVFSVDGEQVLVTAIPEFAETVYETDGVSFRPQLPPEGYTNETIGLHWMDKSSLLIQLGLPGVDVVAPEGRAVNLDGVWDISPPRWPELGLLAGDTLYAIETNPFPVVEVYGVNPLGHAEGS